MTLDTTQDYGLLEADRILPLEETAGDFGPDMLALLLDELVHGTLIINVRGRILHANQAARRELDSAANRNLHQRGEREILRVHCRSGTGG